MDARLIKSITQSWFAFWKPALDGKSIEHIYQTCDPETGNGKKPGDTDSFVLVTPVRQWGYEPLEETINCTFALAVITRQEPDQILTAHYASNAIQTAIHDALFAPEREVFGAGAGVYAIPLYRFDNAGEPTLISSQGISYSERLEWTDRTPDGEAAQLWVVEINVSVNP